MFVIQFNYPNNPTRKVLSSPLNRGRNQSSEELTVAYLGSLRDWNSGLSDSTHSLFTVPHWLMLWLQMDMELKPRPLH